MTYSFADYSLSSWGAFTAHALGVGDAIQKHANYRSQGTLQGEQSRSNHDITQKLPIAAFAGDS